MTTPPTTLYICGNGNIAWADFKVHYEVPLLRLLADEPGACFAVGDFRGADALALEVLKTATPNVRLYHVGHYPRYLPDKFKTFVPQWQILGGFASDQERDHAAIDACTHFLGVDFNSDTKRTSGTAKNLQRCLSLGKLPLV
jgi:hypothetical protein